MGTLQPDGRVPRYTWSLLWVRKRIEAHRRAAEFESGRRAEFHAAQADLWDWHNRSFLDRDAPLNVRVLDFYRPPPPEAPC